LFLWYIPQKQKAKTLKELIGDLPSLIEMGEISDDIFHAYREFNKKNASLD